jgi:hypothetical protein
MKAVELFPVAFFLQISITFSIADKLSPISFLAGGSYSHLKQPVAGGCQFRPI